MTRLFSILAIVASLACSASFAKELTTLDDVRNALFGADLNHPAENSWLGKYLKATKASVAWKRFLKAPPGNVVPPSEYGEPRLVISVDVASASEFRKVFLNKHMLYQVHYPNAGALQFSHSGYKENSLKANYIFENYPINSFIIPILLKESEADRANLYFSVFFPVRTILMQPWLLVSRTGQPYMPANFFAGCTHWFGDLPIGDKLVTEYDVPSGDVDGSHPLTQKIIPFDKEASLKNAKKYGIYIEEKHQKDFETLKKIWGYPGHQMLGEMLDVPAHRRGEYANLGWLAHSLLGSASTERIPIVFRLVKNAQADTTGEDIPFQTNPH